MELTIGKFAEAVGVGVETVRYYQRQGLLPTPAAKGSIRRYGAEDVRRLRFIRMAQRAGFSLREIQELLALDASRDHRRARDLAKSRIKKLDDEIAAMQEARDYLIHLAKECERKSSKTCPILASFGG